VVFRLQAERDGAGIEIPKSGLGRPGRRALVAAAIDEAAGEQTALEAVGVLTRRRVAQEPPAPPERAVGERLEFDGVGERDQIRAHRGGPPAAEHPEHFALFRLTSMPRRSARADNAAFARGEVHG